MSKGKEMAEDELTQNKKQNPNLKFDKDGNDITWTVAVVAVLVPVEVHEKCNSEAKDRQCFNWVNHDDI